MSLRALLSTLLVLSAIGGAHGGDLTIRQRVTGADAKGGTYEETQYLTATKRVTDGSDRVMIIDLQARSMTLALKEIKAYQTISFEQIRRETEMLRARLEQLPPEAKKMMPDLDGEVTVDATGKTDTLIGHPAKQYVVKSGLATGDIWVTEDFMPPGDVAAWQDAMGSMSGPQGPGGKLAAAMVKLKGVPLKSTFTTHAGGRDMTITTEVTSISDEAVPAEALKLPAGYTEKPLQAATPKSPGKKK